MSNAGGEDFRIWNREWKFYVGVTLPCLAGLVVANIITSMLKLKKPERVTVSVECCYQNVGIATSVALTMFDGDQEAEAMGVPLLYGILEAVILGIYCIIAWKSNWTKAPPNAPFWHMLTMSYEVMIAEKCELQAIEVQLADDSKDTESLSDDEHTFYTYFRIEDLMVTESKKEPSGLPPDEYLAQQEEEEEKLASGRRLIIE
jgi:hypothetical protein